MLSRHIYICIGGLLIFAAGVMSLANDAPLWSAPYSFFVLLPAIIFSLFSIPSYILVCLSALPVSLCYVACMLKGSQRVEHISNLGVVFITLTALVSILVQFVYLQEGLAHQGYVHVISIFSLNVLFILSLPVLYWRHVKVPTCSRYFHFYTVYFLWLAFSAIPWFGEAL